MPRTTDASAELSVHDEVRRVRGLARRLLVDLISNRAASEQRLAAAGAADPLKSMTGSSALDAAVDTTRDMLRSLEELDGTRRRTAPLVEPTLETAGVALTR